MPRDLYPEQRLVQLHKLRPDGVRARRMFGIGLHRHRQPGVLVAGLFG